MASLRSIIFILVLALSLPAFAQGADAAQPVHAAPVEPGFLWREALGCVAVAMLIVSRLQEPRYPQFLCISLICASICTVYGFVSGAWPLGLAMGAYFISIFVTRPRSKAPPVSDNAEAATNVPRRWQEPTRIARLFGSN